MAMLLPTTKLAKIRYKRNSNVITDIFGYSKRKQVITGRHHNYIICRINRIFFLTVYTSNLDRKKKSKKSKLDFSDCKMVYSLFCHIPIARCSITSWRNVSWPFQCRGPCRRRGGFGKVNHRVSHSRWRGPSLRTQQSERKKGLFKKKKRKLNNNCHRHEYRTERMGRTDHDER